MTDRNIGTLKRIRFALEYVGVRIMLAIAALLPLRFSSGCGAVFGWLAWEVFRVRRDVVIDNIMRGLGVERARATEIGRRSHMNSGRVFMETAAFGRVNHELIRRIVRMENREIIDEAYADGRGVIIWIAHYGPWAMFGAAMAANGYPYCAIAGRQSNPWVDRLLMEQRRRLMVILPQDSRARAIIGALKKGWGVTMVADQDAGRRGVFVDFLGRKASAFEGPAGIATLHGCPAVVGLIRRLPGSKYVVSFVGPWRPDPELPRPENVQRLTQHFFDALGDAIREYPAEYFWSHRRWKTRPPGEVS